MCPECEPICTCDGRCVGCSCIDCCEAKAARSAASLFMRIWDGQWEDLQFASSELIDLPIGGECE